MGVTRGKGQIGAKGPRWDETHPDKSGLCRRREEGCRGGTGRRWEISSRGRGEEVRTDRKGEEGLEGESERLWLFLVRGGAHGRGSPRGHGWEEEEEEEEEGEDEEE